MISVGANPAMEAIPCIARQPILTADECVIGYELFFRESPEQRSFKANRDDATSATIDMLNVVGLGMLCDGRLAFINCTRHLLLSDYFSLLPPNDVAIEIQENVPADAEVITACQRLKQQGYSIALDNFVFDDTRKPLLPYARFIKVDITRVPWEQSASMASLHASDDCRMLAQKVETREQFVKAQKSGFTRFQGYFFRHPENLQARRIPANQITNLRLLAATSKPDMDFEEIESLVKREPSLCYRLLRYLNSPLLGLSVPVVSVRNALNLLGEREFVKWTRMATTLVMGEERPSDLVLSSLVRARFCELIAPKVEHGDCDLFLMGMLSLIDSILAVPMGMVISELFLDPKIKEQLLGARTNKKTPLSPIYDLMIAREAGDWELVTKLGKQLNLSLAFSNRAYNDAMRWAHEITAANPTKRESDKPGK